MLGMICGLISKRVGLMAGMLLLNLPGYCKIGCCLVWGIESSAWITVGEEGIWRNQTHHSQVWEMEV